MKCKECNGLGKIRLMPFNYVCTCAECKGTGETKDWLTNEEYIHSIKGEQLVEFLVEHAEELTAPDGDYHKHVERFVVEWLKEIHE